MNKLIMLPVLMSVFSFNSYASSSSVCEYKGTIAKTIMNIRQGGKLTALDLIMKLVPADNISAEKANDDTKEIIIRAYKEPLFSSFEYAEKSINEFSNKIYIECMSE